MRKQYIVFIFRKIKGIKKDFNILALRYLTKPFNAIFPLPHVCPLRRLRTAIRLVRFGYNTFTECVA